jgi:mono/diheme cytochrome c family protein
VTKKITEVAFLFLLFGGSNNALAHHELANRNLSKGQKNYQSFCASCHGANLEGQPNWRDFKEDGSLPAPPHDETGHTWHHETEMLFNYTKLGGQATLEAVGVNNYLSGMPAFEELLSDVEI